MGKSRELSRGSAQVEKEGWASLQGLHGQARPVRAVLTDSSFKLYSTTVSKYPTKGGSSSTTIVETSGIYPAPHGSGTSLAGSRAIAYRSVEAPHPHASDPLDVEARAHALLFRPEETESYTAVALTTNVSELVSVICLYLELLSSRSLAGASGGALPALTPTIPQRIFRYCEAVLGFTSLVLNTATLTSVVRLASALGSLDAQLAEQTKLKISKAQEDAQRKLQQSFTPGGGGSSDDEPSSPSSPPTSSSRWAGKLLALAERGQSLPHTIMLEHGFVEEFAEQTAAFHRRIWRHWPPTSDVSLLFHNLQAATATTTTATTTASTTTTTTGGTTGTWGINPLLFDVGSPHFLGTLAALHILNPEINDHKRALLIEKWIFLAARLRDLGDSVGWIAIILTLFEPAVLRLTSAWSKVDSTLLARLAHGWGYEAFEVTKRAAIPFLDKKAFRTDTEDMGTRISKRDCVPYFGDAIVYDACPNDGPQSLKILARLNAIIDGWKSYYDRVQDEVPPRVIKEDPAHQCYFAVLAQQQPTCAKPDKYALSLTIQKKFLGYYLPSFYQHTLPLTSGTMIPVFFTVVMPDFRLFPRPTLVMASQSNKQTSKRGASHHNHHNHQSHHHQHQNQQQQPPHPQQRILRRSSSFPPAGPAQTTGVSELDSRAREQLENTASAHVLGQVVRDLLNVGTETIDVKADIIFKAFASDSEYASNPRNSRTSSIIETLSKRRSYAGRQVVVKSASMVRLVDVLVLGAGVFGTDITLDAETHIATLLATYRSFCSPAEMLDMLQMRVRCARGAAKILNNQFQVTGTYLNPSSGHSSAVLWKVSESDDPTDPIAIRVISMIIAMLQIWVSDYFFDFMDDQYVLSAGKALFSTLRREIQEGSYPESVSTQSRRVMGAFSRHRYTINRDAVKSPSWLRVVYDTERQRANQQIMRVPPELPVTSLERDGGLAHINRIIDELDIIVGDAFSRITMVDWMKLFEVLEKQTSTREGLFSYTTPQHSSESDLVIQDVYSWLRTLYDPQTKNRVLDSLSEPIVALVRLHCSLVSYFAAQVADPSLAHAHERRDRMTLMLKMLGVLRSRMRYFNLGTDFDDQEGQHIPSFLERAIASAILLPESRAYASTWQAAGAEVARMFPQNANLPTTTTGSGKNDSSTPNQKNIYIPLIPTAAKQGKPATVCLGWIVERLLEIVCCVPNTSVEHPDLINFDKRRYAYNLFKNMSKEFQALEPVVTPQSIVAKYFYLFGDSCRTASIHLPIIDKKLHKESVAREGKTRARVFTDIVAQELEKIKIESRVLEKLDRASASGGNASSSSSASSMFGGLTNSHSFYGLPISQSSTSLYSKRFSRAVPSSSTMDVASILDSAPSERNAAATTGAGVGAGSAITDIPGSNGSGGAPSIANVSASPSKRSNSHSKRSRFGGFFRAVRPLSVLGVSGGSAIVGNPSSPTQGSQVLLQQQQQQQFQQQQQQQQQQPGGFYNHSSGSSQSISQQSSSGGFSGGAPTEDGAETQWVSDESIDLTNRPPVTEYSVDDWQVANSIDIDNFSSIKLRGSTVLSISHNTGPKPETLLLRLPSPNEAQEWLELGSRLMNQKLLASTRVFGVPLDVVCTREAQNIPAFLEALLSLIEERGLDEVGIYRISGSLAAVNGIKQWFNQGNKACKLNDPRWSDINAIAGCIKLYLRELPQPLMTDELFPEFMQVLTPTGVDVDYLRYVIEKLPEPNYHVLDRICRHLKLVVDHSAQNKMNVQNIAIVFSVNFLPPVAMSQMGGMQQIVSTLVLQHTEVFNRSEPRT